MASPQSGSAVFVVADGHAKMMPVRIGERRPGKVEILEGVKAGDAVIVAGQLRVQDGGAVEVLESAADTNPGANQTAAE